MPTYQYACTECGHAFDQVQSFSDDALTVCPVCSGKLRKVYNAVGVVFKGSGFYRNDSRSADTSSVPASSSESKGESKGDSKSETKADKPAASSDKTAAPKSDSKPAASSSSGSTSSTS